MILTVNALRETWVLNAFKRSQGVYVRDIWFDDREEGEAFPKYGRIV